MFPAEVCVQREFGLSERLPCSQGPAGGGRTGEVVGRRPLDWSTPAGRRSAASRTKALPRSWSRGCRKPDRRENDVWCRRNRLVCPGGKETAPFLTTGVPQPEGGAANKKGKEECSSPGPPPGGGVVWLPTPIRPSWSLGRSRQERLGAFRGLEDARLAGGAAFLRAARRRG